MFIRQAEVGAASKTAEVSNCVSIRQEDMIVAMAVEKLGINLVHSKSTLMYAVCPWLLLAIIGVTCFTDGSYAYC